MAETIIHYPDKPEGTAFPTLADAARYWDENNKTAIKMGAPAEPQTTIRIVPYVDDNGELCWGADFDLADLIYDDCAYIDNLREWEVAELVRMYPNRVTFGTRNVALASLSPAPD